MVAIEDMGRRERAWTCGIQKLDRSRRNGALAHTSAAKARKMDLIAATEIGFLSRPVREISAPRDKGILTRLLMDRGSKSTPRPAPPPPETKGEEFLGIFTLFPSYFGTISSLIHFQTGNGLHVSGCQFRE